MISEFIIVPSFNSIPLSRKWLRNNFMKCGISAKIYICVSGWVGLKKYDLTSDISKFFQKFWLPPRSETIAFTCSLIGFTFLIISNNKYKFICLSKSKYTSCFHGENKPLIKTTWSFLKGPSTVRNLLSRIQLTAIVFSID